MSMIAASCDEKKSGTSSVQQTGRVLDFTESLTFLQNNGKEITTLRYVPARTGEERNQGLMDVRSMPQNAGMVFFFEESGELSFWMANTPLPLDIMYVNEDSVIVNIYHSTQPFSDKPLPSLKPARFVIETNGGFCINHDIREGNKVRF